VIEGGVGRKRGDDVRHAAGITKQKSLYICTYISLHIPYTYVIVCSTMFIFLYERLLLVTD